jgi:hypothetical protein
MYEPLPRVPEYTRKNVSFPTYGSVITLKASAANGCLSSGGRATKSPVFGTMPWAGGMSAGEGR